MSKWVLLQLNKGKIGDTQIVSESQIAQVHSPQMVIPETSKYTEMPYSSYALGWIVSPYRGHPMLHHSAGIDGFRTLTTFLPNNNIRLVVLANLNRAPVPGILTYNVNDLLLGL